MAGPDSGTSRPTDQDITDLLLQWGEGDRQAAEALATYLYPELRRLAVRALYHWGDAQALQATELVHEAYAAVAERGSFPWQNRGQFLGMVARIMRNILVDLYRQATSEKRGGSMIRVRLEADELPGQDPPVDILSLHRALDELEGSDREAGRVVELRYFGGLTLAECATTLGLSRATVVRRWRFARAWLHTRLREDTL